MLIKTIHQIKEYDMYLIRQVKKLILNLITYFYWFEIPIKTSNIMQKILYKWVEEQEYIG